MHWQARDIEDDLEDLHREASAMLLMLEVEYRQPTDRECELFDGILAAIETKREELKALT